MRQPVGTVATGETLAAMQDALPISLVSGSKPCSYRRGI